MKITDDGRLVAVELAMVITGQERDHAGKTLRNIPEEIFSSEKFSERSMPGKGNSRTKLVTMQHAIELVMVLPGKVAKETRQKFAEIITRYMAGDKSLIKEIEANAESDEPIAQLARDSLGMETMVQDKKRKAVCEDLEIDERRMACMKEFVGMMDLVNTDWKQDAVIGSKFQNKLVACMLDSKQEEESQEPESFFIHNRWKRMLGSMFQISTSPTHEEIDEMTLYKNFMDSFKTDEEREQMIEILYAACHKGARMTHQARRMIRDGTMVGKANFKACLQTIGGVSMRKDSSNVWVNVKLRNSQHYGGL